MQSSIQIFEFTAIKTIHMGFIKRLCWSAVKTSLTLHASLKIIFLHHPLSTFLKLPHNQLFTFFNLQILSVSISFILSLSHRLIDDWSLFYLWAHCVFQLRSIFNDSLFNLRTFYCFEANNSLGAYLVLEHFTVLEHVLLL